MKLTRPMLITIDNLMSSLMQAYKNTDIGHLGSKDDPGDTDMILETAERYLHILKAYSDGLNAHINYIKYEFEDGDEDGDNGL